MRPSLFLLAALAATTPAEAACVVAGSRWFLGNDTTYTLRVRSGEACLRPVTLNDGAAAIHGLRVIEQARHGIGGISGRSNWAYQSKPGYVGADRFVIEIDGEARKGGRAKTRIAVDVTVEP